MNRNPGHLTAAEMNAFKQRLRDYAATYPDSDFLDGAAQRAGAGHVFTRDIAAKVDDALRNWEQRLRAPAWDPARPPPGYDPLTWKLATRWRTQMDHYNWPAPSRRIIYPELARIIERDHLRENHAPWRDEPGEPGWYRMMCDVIDFFTQDHTDRNAIASWYAHEQLAQPGEATAVISYLKDQAKLKAFEHRATAAVPEPPTPERRARVKEYIARRRNTS